MLTALSTRLRKFLDADGPAHGHPVPEFAKELLLGTRLDEAAAGAADAAQALLDAAAAQGDATTALGDAATADGKAVAAQGDIDAIISGWVTVLNGATTAVQAVGAAFNGKPVVVAFGAQPTAAGVKWVSGDVAGGNLTVTINVDNTADLLVYYMIDGR